MKRALSLLPAMLMLLLLSTVALAGENSSFGGVGLQVVPTVSGELVVLQVVNASPAANQGLLPGDLIYQVGEFQLIGSDFGKVVSEHLWGQIGSSVELFYMRPGVAGQHRIVLQRSVLDPRLTVTPTARPASSVEK